LEIDESNPFNEYTARRGLHAEEDDTGSVDDSVILGTQSLQEPRGKNPALVERSVPDHREVKVRDLIRLLEDNGWYLARIRGSHRQYKHAERGGLVTVAGNRNDDLAAGTLNSILKQAGLKK